MNPALGTAKEGLALLDAEGKYLAVNREYAQLLGYKPKELISRSWARTVHPEDLAEVEAAYQRMLRDEKVELQVRGMRQDGSVFRKHMMIVKAYGQRGLRQGHYCFAKDVTDRHRADDSLRQTTLRLQVLSRRILEVQEQERRHLARELHDEIGQILSTISMNLHADMGLCRCNSGVRFEDSIKIVDHAIHQIHNLSLDLRPSMLDDLGLIAALKLYANRQSETGNFTVNFVVESTGARLPAELEITCYRVVQEALTNVVRHAHAKQVEIEFRQQESSVQLVVRDDGIGFNRDAVRQGAVRGESFGVLGMEERVAILGGNIEINSRPGQGTVIIVGFPSSIQPIVLAESLAKP